MKEGMKEGTNEGRHRWLGHGGKVEQNNNQYHCSINTLEFVFVVET